MVTVGNFLDRTKNAASAHFTRVIGWIFEGGPDPVCASHLPNRITALETPILDCHLSNANKGLITGPRRLLWGCGSFLANPKHSGRGSARSGAFFGAENEVRSGQKQGDILGLLLSGIETQSDFLIARKQ